MRAPGLLCCAAVAFAIAFVSGSNGCVPAGNAHDAGEVDDGGEIDDDGGVVPDAGTLKGLGEVCEGAEECASLRCAIPAPGQAGVCECAKNADCAAGDVCAALDDCAQQCVSPGATGDVCRTFGQEGLCSVTRACADGLECTTSDACEGVTRVCQAQSGVGGPCYADADADADGCAAGLVCTQFGCAEPCVAGGCGDGFTCSSGDCQGCVATASEGELCHNEPFDGCGSTCANGSDRPCAAGLVCTTAPGAFVGTCATQ